MTEEVDINTTIHEDNFGIIVDLLSVSNLFQKEQCIQTESCYKCKLDGETFISYRWEHTMLLRNPYS